MTEQRHTDEEIDTLLAELTDGGDRQTTTILAKSVAIIRQLRQRIGELEVDAVRLNRLYVNARADVDAWATKATTERERVREIESENQKLTERF